MRVRVRVRERVRVRVRAANVTCACVFACLSVRVNTHTFMNIQTHGEPSLPQSHPGSQCQDPSRENIHTSRWNLHRHPTARFHLNIVFVAH
jgi:hypothetical protein